MTTTPSATAGAAGSAEPVETSEALGENRVPGSRGLWWGLGRVDLAVTGGYLVVAVALLWGVWTDLEHGYLRWSLADQNLWEWFFAFVADSLRHLHNPFFTTLQNYPLGVNTMANTVMLGASVPLAPLTLLAGPTLPYVLVLTVGMAGTATAWYWVFSRHLVPHRGAAALGGAFTGFAPPVISHANAHPNWVVGFVIPALVLTCLRLATGTRVRRDGIVLGLLVTVQVFLGEELLLISAIAGFVIVTIWAWGHPEQVAAMWRPFAKGVGIAAAVAGVLLCVPLWWQFAGPQAYHGLPFQDEGTPLDAFTAFPSQSLFGDPAYNEKISMNRTEENAFFGWPLLTLLVVIVGVWWRNAWVRTLGLSTVVLCLFSLGATIKIHQVDTGVPSPWFLLRHVPLFDTLLNTRFAYGAVPLMGALLVLGTEQAWRAGAARGTRYRRGLRALWVGALVAALLPIAPTPFETAYRPSTPAFFADGTWRSYVDPGGTVVPVPLSYQYEVQPLHWQAQTGFAWSMPGGYFAGPGPDGRRGQYGPPKSMMLDVFSAVRQGAAPPFLSDRIRDQFRSELTAWHANVLVLVPGPYTQTLRTMVDDLVGFPGQVVNGTLIWDVRPGHAPPRVVPQPGARPVAPPVPPGARPAVHPAPGAAAGAVSR